MAITVNTNIASLNAQRNLSTSGKLLSQSLQRLSSGLRINSAKDDAAGLAIATRMGSQVRGLNQAARNANDGISLAQTAEGALDEMTNNLQRIRELAIQSANASNTGNDRKALDQEVQQRLAEVERIATQTSFNNKKVLDGSFGTATFQVGASVGETISVSLSTSMRYDNIGQIAQGTSSAEVTVAALSGTGTIAVGTDDAVTIGASTAGNANGQSVGSAYAKAVAINAAGVSGLQATANNNIELVVANVVGNADNTSTYSLRINGVDIFAGTSVPNATPLTSQQITDMINANSSDTGVSAVLSGANLRLSAADGRDIAIGQTVGGSALVSGGVTAGVGGSSTVNGIIYYDGQIDTVANATNNSAVAAAVNGGRLTLTANETISITGDGLIMGFAAGAHSISKDTTTLSTVNVKTVADSEDTVYRIDSALSSISNLRSTFGAIQNRFESTIANLMNVSENISAARARIMDADFAAETADLTKAQILQQAGLAMLSQANQVPQAALTLLQG